MPHTAFEVYKQEHKDAKKSEFTELSEQARKPYEQKAAREEIEQLWASLTKKIRRLNGWTLFVQRKNAELAEKGGLNFSERNRVVCKSWAELGAEGKEEYNKEAEKLNAQRGLPPKSTKERKEPPVKKEEQEEKEDKVSKKEKDPKDKKVKKDKEDKKEGKRKVEGEEKKKPSLKKKKHSE